MSHVISVSDKEQGTHTHLPLVARWIGIVPESKAVLKASNTGTPVILDENSDAGVAYQDAIERFLGENIPFKFVHQEKKGILRRLFGKAKEEMPS